jgi:hypothetical protein
VIVPSGLNTQRYWPRLAQAPDGGFFVAWATCSTDTTTTPSRWRLLRRTPSGAVASGWNAGGKDCGPFACELLPDFSTPLIDVAPDGRGGAFLFLGDVTPYWSWYFITPTLFRFTGAGSSAMDWPAEGRTLPWVDLGCSGEADAFRVLADGHDGAIVANGEQYTDSPVASEIHRCTPAGQFTDLGSDFTERLQIVVNPDGGIYRATFSCCNPVGYGQIPAYLRVEQTPPGSAWTGLSENHAEYGDIALASTNDGGAVLFWSQRYYRNGVFALRFGPNGQTTAAPDVPVAVVARLHVRFVAGRGLLFDAGTPVGKVDVIDVAGSRIRSEFLPAGSRELALPETAKLPSGVYFVRLASGVRTLFAKVIVAR